MKCVDCVDRLVDYSDGALVPREAEAIAAHLAVCTDCSAELGDLKRVVEMVRGLEPVEVPASFRVALRQRIRVLPPRSLPLWRRLGVVGLGVPATLAAALVGFAVFTFAAPKGIAIPKVTPPAVVAANPSPSPSPQPGGRPQPNPQPVGQPQPNPQPNPQPSPSPSPAPAPNPGTAATGTSKPPLATQPTATISPNLAGIEATPTATVVPDTQPEKHLVRNAVAEVSVTDLNAALTQVEARTTALNGKIKVEPASNGGTWVTITVSPTDWYSAIALVKELGNVVSLKDTEPVDATANYAALWTDYTNTNARKKDLLSQLEKTTDAGERAAKQSTLDEMQHRLDLLQIDLNLLDFANKHGIVQATLQPMSATADTYTAAPVTGH